MIKVTLRGADELQKDLDEAAPKLADAIDDLESELAHDTATIARRRAGRGALTGRSRDSIQVRGNQVHAGQGVPWYNFADFGGRVGIKKSVHRDFIKGGRWLFPAVREVDVYKKAEAKVNGAIRELQ